MICDAGRDQFADTEEDHPKTLARSLNMERLAEAAAVQRPDMSRYATPPQPVVISVRMEHVEAVPVNFSECKSEPKRAVSPTETDGLGLVSRPS